MQIVWKRKEVTVGELHKDFRAKGTPLALPSIRTMLGILQEKGYVTRMRKGRRHAYRPLVSEDQAHKSLLKDMLDRVFGGSPLNLVSSLLNTGMISQRELKKVKTILMEHERRKTR
jgi:predicted transcriptional regulator